jgi:hypothetical protein
MNPWPEHVQTDPLADSVRSLEDTLAAAPDQVWGQVIVGRLRDLEEALTRHIDTAESAYAEIDVTSSTLVRRLDRHRLEHISLMRQAFALREAAEGRRPGESPTTNDFRSQIAELLNAIRRHQAVEHDLVYESNCTDIGAGD